MIKFEAFNNLKNMNRETSEWLKQYKSISPKDRRRLGITKQNFKVEFNRELSEIRRLKRMRRRR